MTVPVIPGWDGIHPVMVQFTVALLLLAPVFLVVSLFSRRAWRTWAGAALLTMALGTLAAWLAVGSGHAAGQLVQKDSALVRAIASHEALGIQTRSLFTWLTAAFAALMLVAVIVRKTVPTAVRIGVLALFLVLYAGSSLVIANAASQGGRLVHELGVQAMVARAEPRETPGATSDEARPEPPLGTPQAPPPPAR